MLPQLTLKEYYPLMQEADVALFRGQSWGKLIGRGSESVYSHVGLLSRHNGLIELVEFVESKGGRTVNFETVVKEKSNIIDIYRPIPVWPYWQYNEAEKKIKLEYRFFNGRAVTNTMRQMTGLPYGYRRIWWILKHKMFILRLFYNVESLMVDTLGDIVYPVCSTSVSYSFNKHGYDVVKNRSDQWTEPGQFAMSPALSGIAAIIA